MGRRPKPRWARKAPDPIIAPLFQGGLTATPETKAQQAEKTKVSPAGGNDIRGNDGFGKQKTGQVSGYPFILKNWNRQASLPSDRAVGRSNRM